ncbi:hypothetical protein M404DRAFT_849171 [Pisolithus tinctorius Marx 270]|uniref:Uncharacterized protein n=1 Tax=Pisolithus tinctorius Marx 270 TaxID=870435 RepID=A0A0C3NST3_PISTI|nr:hypothetical protein M404DRAFT_849171 [Pisolithus tinctorius Marx 270]
MSLRKSVEDQDPCLLRYVHRATITRTYGCDDPIDQSNITSSLTALHLTSNNRIAAPLTPARRVPTITSPSHYPGPWPRGSPMQQ